MLTADRWEFKDLNGNPCAVHPGLIVSSDTLVNNAELKKQIMNDWPLAVGGEMECYSLYTAGRWKSIPWILIKGISDWGDGTKSDDRPYHPLASASSASLFHEFCQIPNVLSPLRQEEYKIYANAFCDIKVEHQQLGGVLGNITTTLGQNITVPEFHREYCFQFKYPPIEFKSKHNRDWDQIKQEACTEFVNILHNNSLLPGLKPDHLLEKINMEIPHPDSLLGVGSLQALKPGVIDYPFTIVVHLQP